MRRKINGYEKYLSRKKRNRRLFIIIPIMISFGIAILYGDIHEQNRNNAKASESLQDEIIWAKKAEVKEKQSTTLKDSIIDKERIESQDEKNEIDNEASKRTEITDCEEVQKENKEDQPSYENNIKANYIEVKKKVEAFEGNQSIEDDTEEKTEEKIKEKIEDDKKDDKKESFFTEVEETYFDDVLFIGDSRTLGLAEYARLGEADYFSSSGMTVFDVLIVEVADARFKKMNLVSLLEKKDYKTIYIMLGINEIGYPNESIGKKYKEVLDNILELQPDAKVILEANLHVTKERAKQNKNFQPKSIEKLNKIIKEFADNETIFYQDSNDIFVDRDGYLKDDVSSDGIHPYAAGYRKWSKWFRKHALVQ